ncbi:4-hydroxy-tetrahydrodipicolinate reductase [Mechercharimyces sp. CAU 1602]|uniref:4-hydroxy-tetrahydrodipicolinate reductase n=1 Tax=Mechercharimyces sp. CAU 1602 TaxID=2973933 RepID=UPI0021614EEC|nr:4-hydroxy-tetrahydrodipicolinate reductase [Mechercharimyces sp. CAU 1602]MCS1351009.1 4-hydroxy-tetrahydrodipicolinate reductase [Mechercharimyces sp. CAU 1602]
MAMIRVAVAGASGRMGQETVKMIVGAKEFELVSGISRTYAGREVGDVLGVSSVKAPFYETVEEAIHMSAPDVLVDFTTPDSVQAHMKIALEAGVRPVIGTSGLADTTIAEMSDLASEHGIGAIIAPNFAIGAVLMMMFAQKAARYFPDVEIMEMHHDRKLDAPSGTAIKTADLIKGSRTEKRQGHPEEKEVMLGARGAYSDGFRIHSIRLPGLVAHQEVIFGAAGQLLSIRHDSFQRESFMPGVHMAIQEVMKLDHLVYGLEHLLDL